MTAGRKFTGAYARSRRKEPLPEEAAEIQEWLRQYCRKMDVTQEDLAERTGLSLRQVCRFLTGCSEMKLSALVRVMMALKIRIIFQVTEVGYDE